MHEGTNSKQKQSQLFSHFKIHKEKNSVLIYEYIFE